MPGPNARANAKSTFFWRESVGVRGGTSHSLAIIPILTSPAERLGTTSLTANHASDPVVVLTLALDSPSSLAYDAFVNN